MEIEECRSWLDRHRGEYWQIAHEAGLSYSWIIRFAAGDIVNPGVYTIRKLASAIKRIEDRSTPV